MLITKEHYVDKSDLTDFDVFCKVSSIFITLSNGESKITEGTIRMTVDDVLALEPEYKKEASKIKPARG